MPQPSSMLLRHLAAQGRDALACRLRARRRPARGAAPHRPACQRGARRRARPCARIGARPRRPATLPKTSSSVSELEPSRLAPWMPTLEHSPAEYRPGSGDGGAAVGLDAAHGVVHRGQHRDRRLRRIDAEVFLRQLVDLRQALAQLLLAQVAQVEVHRPRRAAVDACGPCASRASRPGSGGRAARAPSPCCAASGSAGPRP